MSLCVHACARSLKGKKKPDSYRCHCVSMLVLLAFSGLRSQCWTRGSVSNSTGETVRWFFSPFSLLPPRCEMEINNGCVQQNWLHLTFSSLQTFYIKRKMVALTWGRVHLPFYTGIKSLKDLGNTSDTISLFSSMNTAFLNLGLAQMKWSPGNHSSC